jgi:hypothetical protein
MMLPSTCRATGADLCDMNFLNLIELVSSMFSQQAGEARHESSADNHRQVAETRFLIEGE